MVSLPNFLKRRKEPKRYDIADVVAEIKTGESLREKRGAISRINNYTNKLIQGRIKQLYYKPKEAKKIVGDEYNVWVEIVKNNGGKLDNKTLKEIQDFFGYDHRILSDGQKRALIQYIDQYLTKYVFPLVHGIDEPKASELIENYEELLEMMSGLKGKALDGIITIQRYLVKWGWKEHEVGKPIIAVIQLPIQVTPEPYMSEMANVIIDRIKREMRYGSSGGRP